MCLEIFDLLEDNRTYVSRNPYCEPQIGRRGLYGALGGEADARQAELALLWVLNLADGHHSLLDVAERSGLHFSAVRTAAATLADHGLLKDASECLS
jgi:aminopeptidase-like protein